LLSVADPSALVASLDAVVRHTHHRSHCALYIDLPDAGWTRWSQGEKRPVTTLPATAQSVVDLQGVPIALLDIVIDDEAVDVVAMIREMAASIRPAIDQYLARRADARRIEVLSRDSLTDPLTGLGNRRALDLTDPGGRYTLISLDLDHFKAVNDTFGHASGDLVLRRVADSIRAEIRVGDSAFRMGGEEFLVLLPDTSAEAGVVIAERIRAAIAAQDLDGHAPGGGITASAGVAHSDGESPTPLSTVLARADAALYAAKDLGRDRVTLALPPTSPDR